MQSKKEEAEETIRAMQPRREGETEEQRGQKRPQSAEARRP